VKKTLSQIILFILICFYYEWFTNINNHINIFFGVDWNSFLGIIAILFWGLIAVLTGLFLFVLMYKNLFKINNPTKKIKLEYRQIEKTLVSIFNNKIGKLMLGLFLVFFTFFSSSSKYYNNYYGLSLEYDDIEFYDYYSYYEYVEEEFSSTVAENFYSYNNDLFSNEESKSRDLKLTEHLFSKQEFIFRETGVFQGYSDYSLKEGFFSYLKCLFFSFLETTYRAIFFFLIIGSPLFLLVTNFDENLRYIRRVKKTKVNN